MQQNIRNLQATTDPGFNGLFEHSLFKHSLLKAVADLHSNILDAPTGANSFDFMQFWLKFGKSYGELAPLPRRNPGSATADNLFKHGLFEKIEIIFVLNLIFLYSINVNTHRLFQGFLDLKEGTSQTPHP